MTQNELRCLRSRFTFSLFQYYLFLILSGKPSGNQAIGHATQHDSVPIPSQDKLGGLRQEGHLAIKNGEGYRGGGAVSSDGVASIRTVGASGWRRGVVVSGVRR